MSIKETLFTKAYRFFVFFGRENNAIEATP